MSEPSISVIVPVYNTEKYLPRALDSILTQNFSDVELVCVDDCSTDSSLSILQEYKKNDGRVKLFRNEKNEGAGYTKNFGMKMATGKYLCVCDSDDYIVPGALAFLYEAAEKEAVDVVFHPFFYITEGEKKLYSTAQELKGFSDGSVYSGPDFVRKMNDEKCIFMVAHSFFFKRSTALPHTSFSEHTINDDFQFGASLLSKAHSILFKNKETYIYNKRSHGSISNYAEKNRLGFLKENINLSISVYKTILDICGPEKKDIAEIFAMWGISSTMSKSKLLSDDERLSFLKFVESQKSENLVSELIKGASLFSVYVNISSSTIKRLKSKSIWIYGAGIYAAEILTIFLYNELNVRGIVVSDIRKNKKMLAGIPVYDIKDFDVPGDAVLVVAVSPKFYDSILAIPKIRQFSEVILSKDL